MNCREYQKLMKWTKPIRFRTLRKIGNLFKSMFERVKEFLTILYCELLCLTKGLRHCKNSYSLEHSSYSRMNILCDDGSTIVFPLFVRKVEEGMIKGHLIIRTYLMEYIEEDYYYYEKDGNEDIFHVVLNNSTKRTQLRVYPDKDIRVCVAGNEFPLSNSCKGVVSYVPPTERKVNIPDNVIYYDFSPIKEVRATLERNYEKAVFTEEEVNDLVDSMKEYFRNLKLNDFIKK